jgi:hypothetical protein
LKQALRLWHRHINAFLLSLDFTQSEADLNLYLRDDILLLLYVDDILLAYAAAAAKEVEEIKAKLAETYEITNLGPARQFLGIEIYHENDGSISISQKAFIDTILKWFHMGKAYDAATPLDERVKLDLIEEAGEKEIEPKDY